MTTYVPLSDWNSVTLPASNVDAPSLVRLPIPLFAGSNLFFIRSGSSNAFYDFGDDATEIEVDPVTGANSANALGEAEFSGVPYGATHIAFVGWSGSDINFKIKFVRVER